MTPAVFFLLVAALAAPQPAQALNEVVSVGYQQFVPSAVAQGQVLTLSA